MELPQPKKMREYERADRSVLDEEIRPARQPAVLRGVASDWPAVQAARKSDETFVDYVMRFSTGEGVPVLLGEPEIQGRFFYSDDLGSLNFKVGKSALEPFLNRLLRDRDNSAPVSLAIQSEIIAKLLPGFETENRTSLVRPDVQPRAWIGNRIRVAPHNDLYENLGVVVAGRRRFTLFPPEQVVNLYVGPFELTPAGTPISLVDLQQPDLARFPRFAEAMQTAQVAELDAGDAIYIPYNWWHAVDSLEGVNFFANYWWSDARADLGKPYDALLFALFALKHLPPEQRDVWRTMFDHFVFEVNGDPAGHLPENVKGILGKPGPELLARMRSTLREMLRQV